MRSGQELPSGLQNRPGPGTTKELAESVRRPGIALTGSLDSTDSAPVQNGRSDLTVQRLNNEIAIRNAKSFQRWVSIRSKTAKERTVSCDDVIELASEWAASFYEDESLEVADVEIRIESIRFWLVTFTKAGTDEEFYAAVPAGRDDR